MLKLCNEYMGDHSTIPFLYIGLFWVFVFVFLFFCLASWTSALFF